MARYNSLPLPMEGWMVKRGWDEQEVLRRLDECSLLVMRDPNTGERWYEEPLAEQWADLWSNDGKPGFDHDSRMEVREVQKKKYQAILWRQEHPILCGLGQLLWPVWQLLVMLIVLPLYCMGTGDAIRSMLGTGEYAGKGDD